MCFTCWQEMGQPYAYNPDVERAIKLILAVMENHSEDSALIEELKDWNIDNRSLQATLGLDIGFLERRCIDHLVSMPPIERASALARACGYRCQHEIDAATTRCSLCGMYERDIKLEK